MSATEILVIFLSVALAVFLALGIVLVAYLIIIAQKVKRMAETAEQGVQNVANIIATLQKAAAPAIISRFVMEQINRFTQRRSDDKKGD